ncbi:MAG TPA: DUF6651 domain-containing protein [Anaerolineae bacterium]|nr:hypothetical protein [Methanosarcinaceae archaeon]HUT62944.1 DUF6651 domain-containing protein [Anaerolineae bacterium]
MAMKLKLDQDGHAVVKDGKPVYIHDDGKEIPFDAQKATEKISELNENEKKKRFDVKSIQEKLDVYKIGEDQYLDPVEAKKAVDTVKNLDAGKLIDAGKVDKLKSEIQQAYVEKDKEKDKQFKAKEDAMLQTLKGKEDTIYKLLVVTKFANSPTVIDKTNLPPDIAADYFGKHFKVEGEGLTAKVIGYIDNEKILSRERPGEVAEFEEALTTVIEHYPMKDRILRTTGGGSASQGNTGGRTSAEDKQVLMNLPPVERMRAIRAREAHQKQ